MLDLVTDGEVLILMQFVDEDIERVMKFRDNKVKSAPCSTLVGFNECVDENNRYFSVFATQLNDIIIYQVGLRNINNVTYCASHIFWH